MTILSKQILCLTISDFLHNYGFLQFSRDDKKFMFCPRTSLLVNENVSNSSLLDALSESKAAFREERGCFHINIQN